MISLFLTAFILFIFANVYAQDSANDTVATVSATVGAITVATSAGTLSPPKAENQTNMCLNAMFERNIPSPGGCGDKADCDTYGTNFFCENIGNKKFCCPIPHSKNSTVCEDKSSDCEQRAQDCINSQFYSMMLTKCRKTCNRCDICKDIQPDCPNRKGYCNNEVYRDLMVWQCPVTCNFGCNRPAPSKGSARSAIYQNHNMR